LLGRETGGGPVDGELTARRKKVKKIKGGRGGGSHGRKWPTGRSGSAARLSAFGPIEKEKKGGAMLKEQDRPDWAKRRKGKKLRERELEGGHLNFLF
jgi:hypothetical protein